MLVCMACCTFRFFAGGGVGPTRSSSSSSTASPGPGAGGPARSPSSAPASSSSAHPAMVLAACCGRAVPCMPMYLHLGTSPAAEAVQRTHLL